MAEKPQSRLRVAFSVDSLSELWSEKRLVEQVAQDFASRAVVTVVGSPFTNRAYFLNLVKVRLQNEPINLTLNKSHVQSGELIIWKYIIESLLETFTTQITIFPNEGSLSNLLAILKQLSDLHPIYLIIDEFQLLQASIIQETIISGLKAISVIPNIHLMIAGDIYPSGDNLEYDFPFFEFVAPVNLSKEISLSQLKKQIEFSPDLRFEPGLKDLIIEYAGNEPILIQHICHFLATSAENEKRVELYEADVESAARSLVNQLGDQLFKEQWLSLSYLEEMTLMIFMLTEFVALSADEIVHMLIEGTAVELPETYLEIDFTKALDLLKRKGILYYSERTGKFVFGNYLIGLWLGAGIDVPKYPDRNLGRILGKGFASLLCDLLSTLEKPYFSRETEAKIAKLSLSLMSHGKEKFYNDFHLMHFPRIAKSFPVILHISDIQLGDVHAFVSDQDSQGSLSSELLADILNNYNNEDLLRPNIIVISGDIANTGMPEEYALAINLINRLSHELGIDKSRIVLVPGNHDVNYLISHGVSHVFDAATRNYVKDLDWQKKSLYQSRMAPFEEFHYRVHTLAEPKIVIKNSSYHYTIHNLSDEFKLLIIGFDSCSFVDHERRYGFISEDAIDKAEKEIKDRISDNAFIYKIAVWHHNVNSIEGRDDHLVNWNAVQNLLFDKYNYHLALHGHVHTPSDRYQPYDPDKGITGLVFGAGAIGVREDHRAGDEFVGHMPLSYNLIQLGVDNIPENYKVVIREGRRSVAREPVEWRSYKTIKSTLPKI